ncbi:hypothetical protein Z945_3887 [Sulfitobacter noctilucae]|nr:hypothetical protein Z945_3887 [Sulfitobacter noctilucae]
MFSLCVMQGIEFETALGAPIAPDVRQNGDKPECQRSNS